MNKRGKVRIKNICAASFSCIILFFTLIHLPANGQIKSKSPSTSQGKVFLSQDTVARHSLANKDSIFRLWAQGLHEREPDYLLKGLGDGRVMDRRNYISTDSLDAPISYSAEDSGILLIPQKEIWLYGKAKVKYQDMTIVANVIKYNSSTNIVTGYGGVDTSNNPLNKPTVTQGESKMIMDSFAFNMKNQRGLTKNTFYNEGEIYVHADVVKKINKNEMFAYDARMTTCNLDTPHFDFRTKKMKMITGKLAVSGPAWPEFEGVPMPIIIPFGIYPLNRGRHSGFLPPQFANNGSSGLGLEGLGYYKVFNDNWDLTTRGNIYSYGGYQVTFNPRYFKRYKYSGNFNLQIQHTKLLNETGGYANEFTIINGFQVNWAHSMDSKALPGVSFSANVSAGSTRYNAGVVNNAQTPYQNQMNSSITYSKQWDDGKYNLSIAANHNQNNNQHLVNIQVPTVNFSMNTIYPFAKKEMVGTPKWYEKLGVSYSGTFLNQFAFFDTAFSFRRILDTAMYGATHSLPISLSLPALGPLLFSPSVSYSENWYSRKMTRNWNPLYQKIDTTFQRGLFRARQMSFGMGMNTAVYGTFNFGKGDKAVQIHHVIRPTISASYQPNMQGSNYQTVQYDTVGHTMRVSKFQNNIVGAFGEGTFGGMSFGIDNMLEMKVRNTKDTTGKEENQFKKIKLIDGFSITSGYNFLADSLQVQPVNLSLRTTLFEKINITSSASLSPYTVDSLGQTNSQSKLLWTKGSLGRFTSGNIALSASFQSKKKDGKSDEQRIQESSDNTMTYAEQQAQMDYVRNNPAEFVDFDIPWNVSGSFGLNFSRTLRPNYTYYTNVTTSLSLNGDFSLTPSWKIGGNASLDVKTQKIQMLTMFVTREMHCWQMSINITPIGVYKSFSIVLNPKSGLLRDLRINRSRFFYNQ